MTLTNKILIGALILALIFGTWMYFSKESYKHKATIAELRLSDTIQAFKTLTDKYGNIYAEQEARIATQEDAIKAGLLREDDLKAKHIKDVQSLVKAEERATFWKDSTLYYKNNPIIITKIDSITGDTINYMKIPIPFEKTSDWISLAGNVTKAGILIDSLNIISEPSIIIAYTKEKWYKKSKLSIIYENKNPYFKLSKLSNVVIQDEKKFYQKNGFWFGAGTAVGILGTLFLLF